MQITDISKFAEDLSGKINMIVESTHYPATKAVGFGAIGGVIGGVVMYAVMSGVMLTIGMGANCFAVIAGMITGQTYANSLTVGLGLHFLTSIIIGAIFGVAISTGRHLRIRGYGKGIALGVTTGIVAFVVLFLPIMLTVMPPKIMDLMKMMNSQMTENSGGATTMKEKSGTSSQMNSDKMMMEELTKMQSMIMVGSLASHIVYGIVLGVVTTVLILRDQRRNQTAKSK